MAAPHGSSPAVKECGRLLGLARMLKDCCDDDAEGLRAAMDPVLQALEELMEDVQECNKRESGRAQIVADKVGAAGSKVRTLCETVNEGSGGCAFVQDGCKRLKEDFKVLAGKWSSESKVCSGQSGLEMVSFP